MVKSFLCWSRFAGKEETHKKICVLLFDMARHVARPATKQSANNDERAALVAFLHFEIIFKELVSSEAKHLNQAAIFL